MDERRRCENFSSVSRTKSPLNTSWDWFFNIIASYSWAYARLPLKGCNRPSIDGKKLFDLLESTWLRNGLGGCLVVLFLRFCVLFISLNEINKTSIVVQCVELNGLKWYPCWPWGSVPPVSNKWAILTFIPRAVMFPSTP